ncbi:MAG: hypothetical protein ACMUHY_09465 [Thermoplasmatota archaeon]
MALWVLVDLHEMARKSGDRKAAAGYLEKAAVGIEELKGPSSRKNELLLEMARLRFDLMTDEKKGGVDKAADDLAEAIIQTMEPKRSVLYLDGLIGDMRRYDRILPVLESYEAKAWAKGERSGSLVISLRRAALLMEIGKSEKAAVLLRTIIKRGGKLGFQKAVRRAEELMRNI